MPIIPLVGAPPMQPASGVAPCCAMPPKPAPNDPPVARPALDPPELPARDSAATPRKHAKRIPGPTCQCLIVLLLEVGRKKGYEIQRSALPSLRGNSKVCIPK